MSKIEDLNFKLTSQGIHLTRNKYTYHIILYDEIEKSYLIKGKSIKNYVLIFIIGIICIVSSGILLYNLIMGLNIGEKSVRFYNLLGNGLIVVIMLGGAGLISIISALKNTPVIIIVVKNKTYKLRINRRKVTEILDFLSLYGINVDTRN
ncbi:hypothetical protein [Anditalea andensis]|uniref:Uncharacterized protein n=1 Tax=Anditalea andensis TaxID=1048983 RepID=A0A074KS20_9BACT|nr:hypothetical protein [Anditalea andensis]KEO71679.1 hypothetical protein EL17_23260 [Anditalea andensis]